MPVTFDEKGRATKWSWLEQVWRVQLHLSILGNGQVHVPIVFQAWYFFQIFCQIFPGNGQILHLSIQIFYTLIDENILCTVVIFLNRTHQLMDNFVEMNGNSNKTSHNKVINTKEKNIHEN